MATPRKRKEDYKKSGRPTAFKPEFMQRAQEMTQRGATDRELADEFGVAWSTLQLWKSSIPGFSDALKLGKDIADARVEASLYNRAMGFSFDAVKIHMHRGKLIYAPYVEQVPPDTTACIFWLKNRRPDLWRDKTETDVNLGLKNMSSEQLDSKIASLMSNPDLMGSIGPKKEAK